MLNLSRIQLELEKAKEGLREVEETIQKVEGKSFPNGPGRFSNLKIQLHPDKNRNSLGTEDVKLQRRIIASNIEPRNRRIPEDLSLNLKRGPRDKRELGLKRPGAEGRPLSIAARLTGLSQQTVDDEDDEEFRKKLALPSRVITTASEAPSRQEVIAAQTGDELSKQRNRRMFGALVGTLQKFCKEETRVREREEKRLKVEKKLEEDAKREKDKLLQEKRELFLERKRREIEIKRIEWSLNRVKEYEAWEANVMPLKKFIQTHAKPHIFYLPNTHNSKTEERLAQSQRIVERMIEKRKTNLKQEIENSEKKARRKAAEEEEEEAENIPQSSDPVQTVEQPMEIDFDGMNKENGFHEDDSKVKDETSKEKEEQTMSAWIAKKEDKEKDEGETKPDAFEDGKKLTAQESVDSDNLCTARAATLVREGDSDGDGGGEEDKKCGSYKATGEGRTFETEENQMDNEKNDHYDKLETEESDIIHKVPMSECETEESIPSRTGESHTALLDPASPKRSEEKNENTKAEDLSGEEGKKDADSSRKAARRRSGSSTRKSFRRSSTRSNVGSPEEKTDRSPKPRRHSERVATASKRGKSPHSKNRRSSSGSSASAYPKKRMKFRSSSYSRSDSD